jgi:hypothetical protein
MYWMGYLAESEPNGMMLTEVCGEIQTVPNSGWSPIVETLTGGPEIPLI